MNHARRFRLLRRQMDELGVSALLVKHLPDVRYLCGFTGSNAALAVAPRRAALFTDGRYTVQAGEETSVARVAIARKSALAEACAWLAVASDRCAFDPEHTTVAELAAMRQALPAARRRGFFQPLPHPVLSHLRWIKDDDELALMKRAAQLGVRLFEELLPHIRPGATEERIAAQLEYNARCHGAESMSFDTIVASGARSALPHGRATAAPLPRKGFVTFDFGVILNGYCSDMTRSVFLGRPTARERFTYDAVLEAQQAAVEAVRPGATCAEVDQAARGVLRKLGLAKYFTHSTGHGVGLEVHESPRIAAAQPQRLAPGMVVTIEPGVYIPGQFGVRIEDMVTVTAKDGQVLTPAPKAWMNL